MAENKLTKTQHDVKMQTTEIKLECLKLAHTHGRTSAEAIERAKVYESYILGTFTSPVKKTEDSAPTV
jgi:hypothetical protein